MPLPFLRTAAGLLLVVVTPNPANAQTPLGAMDRPHMVFDGAGPPESLGELSGKYRFCGGERERGALRDAVEDVVSEMNVFVRPIARQRLLDANRVAESIEIRVEGSKVTVAFDQRAYSAELGGEAVRVTGVTGDPVSLTHRVDGDRLVQRFEGEGGGRTNVFGQSSNQLQIEVEVHSPQLPKVLAYRLTFSRP